jgi:hypothetical protein
MNIPSTPPTDATANSTAATAAANATAAPTAGTGFLALIGALLQGTTLPGMTAETGTPELALGGELPLLDGAPFDEETGEAEDPDALLASLGLPAMLTPPLPPPPPTPVPAPAEALAAGGQALAAAAVALSAPPPVKVPTPRPVPAASPEAGAATAKLPELQKDGAALEAVVEAISVPRGSDEAGSKDSAEPSHGSLNSWAAAAGRISGGASDVATRTTVVPGEAALRETVGAPRWRDELGTHLTLMAVKGQQSGSLRLSPEHLGPLEIQITVADDKTTSVQFGSQQAETRAALQDALPRLREMFSAAGLQLGDAGVSHQASRQSDNPSGNPETPGGQGLASGGDGEPTRLAARVSSITHSGLLDTYA